MTDKERFSELCEKFAYLPTEENGIGTYREKRLHRILKELVAGEECHEIAVGGYVADVLCDGHITEIQTKNLGSILPKLKYYVEETDFTVTVIHPIIAEKMLFRIDAETGEVLRKRRSSAHGSYFDGLAQLFYIREVLSCERVNIRLLLVSAEEHRYSEKMRYRKEGAYISELYPKELIGERLITSPDDLAEFVPDEPKEFTAKDYSLFGKVDGRKLYYCLNLLHSLGLVERKKDGKKYVYSVKKK